MSKSILEKLREYITTIDRIGLPETEDEVKRFEEIMGFGSIFNYEPLDIAEARKIIKGFNAEKEDALIDVCADIAERAGIECIDTGDNGSAEQNVAVSVQKDAQVDIDNSVSKVNEDVMPIPKIGLSDGSIGRLKEICKVSTEELVQAIKMLSSSRDGLDRPVDVDAPVGIKVTDSDETYTKSDYDNDIIGIGSEAVTEAVQRGMNIIYRGVPGCGKTFMANCDARLIVGHKESNRIKQIDFTENLDYTDTMVGLRQSDDGSWQYIKGEIAQFCEFADRNKDKRFVLILNEFTRANTEAVLGQMFTAMENKYRGREFTLDNGDKFICPKNLIVLATMNGTDRGVKKLDRATEERFYVVDVRPLWEEWATSEDSFNSLIDNLEIRVGSTEYNIVKQLCSVMAEANNIFEDGGILTTDNQIGQRQLLQFVNQTDIDGNQIVYDTKTLKIVIEQLISRVKPMVDMQSQLDSSISELNKLLEECNA